GQSQRAGAGCAHAAQCRRGAGRSGPDPGSQPGAGTMNLDQAFNTFLEESREMLADMERILLELEATPDESELLNALFRCVHTIKGSAGIFGLEHVVGFTHVVENVLDRLRAQQLQLSPKLAELLLRCRDHIAVLVECSAEDVDADLQAVSGAWLAALKPFQAEAAADSEPAAEGQRPAKAPARVEATGGGRVSGDTWHIAVRFSPDVLRHGMDPIGFIRYLRTLGELTHVATISDALPAEIGRAHA